MIVLIPTLLGGIWQILELLRLGAPFVRFFSVSQLVSDGLLILCICLFCLLGFVVLATAELGILSKFVFKSNGGEFQIPEPTVAYRQTPWLLKFRAMFAATKLMSLPLIILVIVPFINWHDKFSFVDGRHKTSLQDIFVIFLVIGSVFTLIAGVVSYILLLRKKRLNFQNEQYLLAKPIITRLLVKVILVSLLLVAPIFHRSFLMPDELKNKEYIAQQVIKKNPRLKSWQIAYFNDKFVFIAIKDSNYKKHIEVMEFNAMFSAIK